MDTTLIQSFSPFALQVRRVTSAVIGRPIELAAIQQEIGVVKDGRLSALTVEGEPGIGKTRLLLAASELAGAEGFATIAVAADQEIRGPFLLARSIVGSADAVMAAEGTPAAEAIQRSIDALSGKDEPGLESLPPDLQWADDDSLRLIRYLVRADAASSIFIMASIRPEEFAFVTEAVNLVADMERLGMVRRLKVHRFSQFESAEFLRQVLGGKVDPAGAAAMHAQAEGVPFILEELAHAYREAGMIQEIDGKWTLAKNADRLVPSAVKTLISRRASHVPEETKAALAEAAILGRHFSLKDVQALRVQLGEGETTLDALDGDMAPAVAAGLLVQHRGDSPADYSFAHDQVREFSASSLTTARRRAIHAAIVDLLLVGEPAWRCCRPATTRSRCCAARPTVSKGWPSWPRWPRRSATPGWRWTSSSAGWPPCACRRSGTRPPPWPARCARKRPTRATGEPSWRPPWSSGRP